MQGRVCLFVSPVHAAGRGAASGFGSPPPTPLSQPKNIPKGQLPSTTTPSKRPRCHFCRDHASSSLHTLLTLPPLPLQPSPSPPHVSARPLLPPPICLAASPPEPSPFAAQPRPILGPLDTLPLSRDTPRLYSHPEPVTLRRQAKPRPGPLDTFPRSWPLSRES